MLPQRTRKTVLTQVVMLLISIFLTVPSYAAVIFEDNFDSQTDWNTSKQYSGYECSIIGQSDPQNTCPASYYPGYGGTKPYDAFRDQPYHSSSNPQLKISRPPDNVDHTSGTGKALTVYYQFNPDNPGYWAGDGILTKYFGPSNNYPELYVRVWIKAQPGWSWRYWNSGYGISNAQAKILRLTHYFGGSEANIYNWPTYNHPAQIWDLCQPGYADAYRCDPNDFYCTIVGEGNYEHDDKQIAWSGTPLDTNWHRYDFHYKINTVGQYDGVYELAFDGNIVVQHTDVM